MTFHGKRYRIKNRFRFITFLTLTFVITFFFVSSMFGMMESDSLSTPEYIEVKVRSGDTLWHIASVYGPDDVDIRRIVYEICRQNDVDADTIVPGQILFIPEYF